VRDRDAAAALLARRYRSVGWRVPELLAAYLGAPDTYFDAVSRVRVPRWSTGPVVLLGDAASCVSLFGDGSSAAIVGASALATALEHSPDLPAALARYERAQRVTVRRGQLIAPLASHVLVPAGGAGIRTRDAVLRLAFRRGPGQSSAGPSRGRSAPR
jgi:2-polyprenyl-6-methoxyphenol hydroxylase-like FAD-dependent oxidoreductase